MTISAPPLCPHCRQKMARWRVPPDATWPNEFFYVCFNDQCPYFVQGWQVLWEQQQTRASYRCRLDPDSGKFVPLPVWSSQALKENIVSE